MLDFVSGKRHWPSAAKVIVVSADVQTSSHDMVIDAGASGFVIKPFEPDEIVAKVTSTLSEAH